MIHKLLGPYFFRERERSYRLVFLLLGMGMKNLRRVLRGDYYYNYYYRTALRAAATYYKIYAILCPEKFVFHFCPKMCMLL
jgi:hypothetical protein